MQDVGNLMVSQKGFKKHASNYDQLLEISHWNALNQIRLLMERPMAATSKLESNVNRGTITPKFGGFTSAATGGYKFEH